MFRRIVGRLCVLSLFTGACAGSDTEPTRTTTSARVGIADPTAGTTLVIGTPFKISFQVQYAQEAFTLYAVAFVRDDGVYSPPFTCGGGGSSGGAFADQTVEVAGVVGPLPVRGGSRTDSEIKGNMLYQFAKGHRVNALLLLKRVPAAPDGSTPACAPLGAGGLDFTKPTEGTVFPENADQRVDMTLNWFIQP